MVILAIDPGDKESAAVVYDALTRRICDRFEGANDELRRRIRRKDFFDVDWIDHLSIEYTPPYTLTTAKGGAYTPRQVVDTAIEIGRMQEAWQEDENFTLVSRNDVKLHLLGKVNGNDTLIKAAIFDQFGGSQKAAKGTKKNPGPLFGFSGSHLYAALGVAITAAHELSNLPRGA